MLITRLYIFHDASSTTIGPKLPKVFVKRFSNTNGASDLVSSISKTENMLLTETLELRKQYMEIHKKYFKSLSKPDLVKNAATIVGLKLPRSS